MIMLPLCDGRTLTIDHRPLNTEYSNIESIVYPQ